MTISNRLYFTLIAGTCIALLAFGYYLEYIQDLIPCPMCIFQRICYMAVGIVALIGAIVAPARSGSLLITGSIGLFSAIGAGIAGRQTWLSLSIAEWSLICFVGLIISALWQFIANQLQRSN